MVEANVRVLVDAQQVADRPLSAVAESAQLLEGRFEADGVLVTNNGLLRVSVAWALVVVVTPMLWVFDVAASVTVNAAVLECEGVGGRNTVALDVGDTVPAMVAVTVLGWVRVADVAGVCVAFAEAVDPEVVVAVLVVVVVRSADGELERPCVVV